MRIPDEFFEALDTDGEWRTYHRTSGRLARTYRARDLWDQIGYAAWRCADPGVQFDTTINAWHTCPSGGRINASNPCSEYMFLDNTACNLASINVLKFYDAASRTFDVDAYEHAIDLWTVVLEISVLMASYPSSEVARLSWKYRTLGLGYANLGAMLMQAGIPYDSDEARAVCACLTSILTGRAYRQSAVMAAQLGAFDGYADDRDRMLRVIRNHRLAAHGVPRDPANYEDLRIPPVPIDHSIINTGRVPITNADDLLDHSTRAWDDALGAGEKFGFRNAQVTVIAPTGTIGLLMDCDTTGIEPDFALVKFKKLAGGGYFKIANESVRPALESMGYTQDQIRGIMTYLLGALTLDVPMPPASGVQGTFQSFLIDRGLVSDDLKRITDALPGVFELAFAFNAWTMGDDAVRRLGLDPEHAKSDPGFSILGQLGLSRAVIAALNEAICGTQMLEDAPDLKPEHLPVFDCASRCGRHGRRFIAPEGHIRMMAAAQPFISGAISKTINLPSDATVADVKASYRLSWELGLKANALYRDGCKLSQPLSTTTDAEKTDQAESLKLETEAKKDAGSDRAAADSTEAGASPAAAMPATRSVEAPVAASDARVDATVVTVERVVERIVERVVERPMRRRLSDTRASITHKFNIAGHEGYLTVGLYEDGMPGELFITMAKEGSTIGGLMDSLGTAVSVALQYGVPVESLVNKFTHQRFEPAGMTANRDIPIAKSLVDYIFRWMGMEFIPGYREANAPRRSGSGTRTPETPDEALDSVSPDGPGAPASQPLGRLAGGRDPGTRRASVQSHVREHEELTLIRDRTTQAVTSIVPGAGGLNAAMRNSQEDAPACDSCGTITVRSGTCYKCMNCGASMGCS